jgi:hypothetical protein
MPISIAQHPHVIFPFHSSLVEQILPTMVTKTMNLHMLPHPEFATIVFCNFDLWMSKNEVDTFALVINYLDKTCTFRHVTMGLFEVHETIGSAMVLQFQALLEKNGLIHCVIVVVKNEGNKIETMIVALQSIIDYEPLKIFQVHEGNYFRHVMAKGC